MYVCMSVWVRLLKKVCMQVCTGVLTLFAASRAKIKNKNNNIVRSRLLIFRS